MLSYNVEIRFSSQSSTDFWRETLRQSQQAFNACAAFVVEHKIPLGMKSVHGACYYMLRGAYPLIPSQGIIRIEKEVMAALKSKRSNKHKGETPCRHTMSMTLDKRLYSRLNSNGIDLTSEVARKRVRADFVQYDKFVQMAKTYEMGDPTMFIRDGRFFLSIPFKTPVIPTDNEDCIGIDLGIKRFITTSNGLVFKDKEFNARKRKLRYLKRCLRSKADKGSKSAKKHLRKLSRKERNANKNQCYLASKVVLNCSEASIIVMEDLTKIKQKTSKNKDGHKRKRHNNAISQVPFYKFKEILTYKATLAGKRVETVSPTWTSQIDSRTGKRDGQRCGCRYIGKDGIVLDADWNAAINIGRRSKHPVSSALPIDGNVRVITGRALSTAHTFRHPRVSGQAPTL